MRNKALQCSAKGCNSSTTKIHKFPKDSERCRMWAERAGCIDLLEKGVDVLHASYGLCADHFHETSYVMNNKQWLSIYALPEIFPELPGPNNTTQVRESDVATSESMCRTCASKSNDLVPVFGEKGIQLKLADKIHTYLPIKITPEDLLPIAVCSSCIWKLGLCHTFTQNCLQADAELRTLFGVKYEADYTDSQEDADVNQNNEIEDDIKVQDTNGEQTTENNLIHDTGQAQSTDVLVYLNDSGQGENGIEASTVDEVTEEYIKYEEDVDEKISVHDDMNLEASSLDHMTEDMSTTVEHVDSEEQPPSLNISATVTILPDCETVQDNTKFKELIVKNINDDTETDISRSSLLNEIRETSEQQKNFQSSQNMSKLTFSDKGSNEYLIIESPALNPSTVIVSTSDKKQNQQNSIAPENKIDSLNDFSPSQEETEVTNSRKTIDKIPRKKAIRRRKIFDHMIPELQPIVVLSRLKFHHSQNTGDEKKIVSLKKLTNKVNDHQVAKIDIEENTDTELQVQNSVAENENTTETSKIIESIDTRIKRNEELLLKTAPKKEVIKEKVSNTIRKSTLQPKEFRCLQCSAVLDTQSMLVEHVRDVHPIICKCSICHIEFIDLRKYKSHMEGHEDGCICEICGQFFSSERVLRHHQVIHTSQSYTCKTCCKIFTNWDYYSRHLQSHKEASYLCELCGKRFKYYGNLWYHSTRCGKPNKTGQQYVCKVCDKIYQSRVNYDNHLRIHTNEKPYQCSKCGVCFRTESQLKYHTFQHLNARQHKCPVCGKGFSIQKQMLVHSRIHQRKYPCSVCEQTFTYTRELFQHRKTHTSEEISKADKHVKDKNPEYIALCTCQVCGKLLSSKFSLKNHMELHSDEKPFQCKVCGKAFEVMRKLNYHSRTHTGIKTHACTLCEKKFLTNAWLKCHYQTHAQERFPCRQCDKSFASRHTLSVHERRHSSENPYKCEVCHKELYGSSSIRSHKLIHKKEKPFKCADCDKSFKRKDILVTHVRVHTGERPYICSICGQGFTQNGYCRQHERSHFKKSKTDQHDNTSEDTDGKEESDTL